MVDAEALLNWKFPALSHTYTERDVILYALALGYGAAPEDEGQLRFVFERDLRVVPAFVNVLCHPGFWISDPATGIDAAKAVHAAHHVHFHTPLPRKATVRGETRVLELADRGAGKGAMLVTERLLREEATGDLLATIEQHTLLRNDGGFSGGAPLAQDRSQTAPLEVPPDLCIDTASLPQSALIYRLSADPNPLHADPATARAAGFPRPILHGLCTYGIVCRALLQACAEDDAEAMRAMGGRFSAPVFPGETIRTEIWRAEGGDEGARRFRFRCSVPSRQIIVLNHGSASFGAWC